MKKLKKSALLVAATVLAACITLSGCKAVGELYENNPVPAPAPQATGLADLQVWYGETNLLKDLFTPNQSDYPDIDLGSGTSTSLVVKAIAEDENAEVTITTPRKQDVGNNTVSSTTDVPVNLAVEITVSVAGGSPYTVTVLPPRSVVDTDDSLASLTVMYSDGGANLLTPQLGDDAAVAYSVQTDTGKTKLDVHAVARSTLAVVILTYGENVVGEPSVDGVANATIDVPAMGKFEALRVTVKQGDGVSTRPYDITVNGPVNREVTYFASVTNLLSDKDVVSVLARNATVSQPTVYDATKTAWKLVVDRSYKPTGFIVVLKDSAEPPVTYATELTLTPNIQAGQTVPLTVDEANIGKNIADANALRNIGSSGKYALTGTIDLADDKDGAAAWKGPSSFTGTFFGNGFTVKNLVLDSTKSDTGLFTSFRQGATVQDLTVEVSTLTPVESANSPKHFGGIVGVITNGGSTTNPAITITGVTVKGNLEFKDSAGYILAGGLVGEIQSGVTVKMTKCASDITVTFSGKLKATNGTIGFGGIVGKIGKGIVTVQQSYAVCNISLDVASGSGAIGTDKPVTAGGIVGTVGDGTNAANLTIEECWTSGEIVVKTPIPPPEPTDPLFCPR